MKELIVDSFSIHYGQRFQSGANIRSIQTHDTELDKSSSYYITEQRCCSNVKITDDNWFYFLRSATRIKRLKRWIDEIAPIFPELDISIISINPDDYHFHDGNTDVPELTISLEGYRNHLCPNRASTVLSLSAHSDRYYCCSNNHYAPTAEFSEFSPIFINSFVDFCSINNFSTLTKDTLLGAITEYTGSSSYNKLVEDVFNGTNPLAGSVMVTISNPAVKGNYYVELIKIVDKKNFTRDAFGKYLFNLFTYSTENLIRLNSILNKEIIKSKNILLVKALYRKKSYRIESYLAHHLIRAGLCQDHFAQFIDQYFEIKEHTPDVHFWNRIMLTQFGFNYYYYYWLTNYRSFNFPTLETFNTVARGMGTDSSHQLFGKFISSRNNKYIEDVLIPLYRDKKFDKFIELCSNPITVSLKEDYKHRVPLLRLKESYVVEYEEGSQFFIKGDDYNVTGFKILYFDIK